MAIRSLSLFPFAGCVHFQIATIQRNTVKSLDRLLPIDGVGHFYETKAARLSGFTIHDDLDRLHLAELREVIPQIVFACVKTQIPDIDVRHEKSLSDKRVEESAVHSARAVFFLFRFVYLILIVRESESITRLQLTNLLPTP